ncbi:MAG: translation initiation factor IF-3 [Austwickia sp.]|nr:MAG: translation initiation factor IF-3 [Austwickia sp.]
MSEPRINDRIRVPEVRLVGPNGEQVGIVRVEDALRLAAEADLDLVEVAPMAKPPVAKLMDFGKYKYEAALKAREARKNQVNTVIKEIKLRPKIDPHDYETKKGHVVRFLSAGDKVKVTIMFRGREQSRPELGFRLLQRLAEDVTELGFVESAPKQDGRNMIMVLGPTKKKAEAKAELRKRRDLASDAGAPGARPPRHHADAPMDEAQDIDTPVASDESLLGQPSDEIVEAVEIDAAVDTPEADATVGSDEALGTDAAPHATEATEATDPGQDSVEPVDQLAAAPRTDAATDEGAQPSQPAAEATEGQAAAQPEAAAPRPAARPRPAAPRPSAAAASKAATPAPPAATPAPKAATPAPPKATPVPSPPKPRPAPPKDTPKPRPASGAVPGPPRSRAKA